MKKYVLPNLPYLLIFYFFDLLGKSYRMAAGPDVGTKLIGMFGKIGEVFASPFLSFVPFDLLIGLIGAVVIRLIIYTKSKNAKKFRKGQEYGTACWGTPENIKPYMDPKPENNIILTATERLRLSGRPKEPKHARNANVLVIGGSGSGKTRFFIKPNLLQGHSSYVCTDPKGIL